MKLKRIWIGQVFVFDTPKDIYMDFIEVSLFRKLTAEKNFWVFIVCILFFLISVYIASEKIIIISNSALLGVYVMFLIELIANENIKRKTPPHSDVIESFQAQVKKIISENNED